MKSNTEEFTPVSTHTLGDPNFVPWVVFVSMYNGIPMVLASLLKHALDLKGKLRLINVFYMGMELNSYFCKVRSLDY